MMLPTILIAEDEASQRFTFHQLCKKAGYDVIEAKDGAEALYFLKQDETQQIGLLLTDLNMPELDGFGLINEARALRAELPIIVLTSSTDANDAVASMQAGANDFISKPVDAERLRVSISNVLQTQNLRDQVKRLTRETKGQFGFQDLIGHDAGLSETITLARKIAGSDLPVLIQGESGSGKEVLARAIHGESSRACQPFIAVNCGAIPANLAESTLFGHEKGAFTGAISQSLGKFREAQGGTLFLDEVGELPLDTQAKLLRALQSKEIEPVGHGAPIAVDVRIISATHRNLAQAVQDKSFREDLFYRLNVLPIGLPPLRARAQDIPSIVEYFCAGLAAREGVPIRPIGENALRLLQSHTWPGNVRELENCISRAMLLASSDTISEEDIAPLLQIMPNASAQGEHTAGTIMLMHADGRHKTLEEIEKEAIQHALHVSGDSIPKAASILGMGQSTLYRKTSG
jgi:DNA-binding NtrC family response regulator